MKALLLWLLMAGVASAAPEGVKFATRDALPVTVSLVLPEFVSVASHERTQEGDHILAQVAEGEDVGRPGLVVKVADAEGHEIWSHDFGFNLSAVPGCGVTVACHPTLPLVFVSYAGYKWDHASKLLRVTSKGGVQTVHEYQSAEQDILPMLAGRRDFNSGHRYAFEPTGFTRRGVKFECIPLQKPELGYAHPFAQEGRWYEVTATVGHRGEVTPTKVTASH